MSVVKNSKHGWFISHELLINEIYSKVDDSKTSFKLKPELFNVFSPYKIPKDKQKKKNINQYDDSGNEVRHVEKLYKLFYNENRNIFDRNEIEVMNEDGHSMADVIYNETGKHLISDLYGANPDGTITKTLGNSKFLFPDKCKFYAKDVFNISEHLKGEKYDLILLDPPWWNKYIRRKRKHSEHGYDMMYNEDLKNLPLEDHLNDDSLVVVWCTNSNQHLNALCNEIFPKWGLNYVGKWYWVKVTTSGVPICPFSEPPRKQPFEQIIIGCRKKRRMINPPCDRLVVSVPSSLHSHKPPLIQLLEPYLPGNSNCLEIFARYLLPNWTSYGKEVLRLQHESLYLEVSK